MANKSLFSKVKGMLIQADARNEAGGAAHRLEPKHALAQLAATGCFNGTFYSDAQGQLEQLKQLIALIDDDRFLAQTAVYAREKAFMKDMPAALLAAVSKRSPSLMQRAFPRVVDDGRMLRTMFQMLRSGQFGRRCLSSSWQRAFQRWLNQASVGKLLSASIGSDPTLRDVLRLARPTPIDDARRAMFGWLTGKDVERWAPATKDHLPAEVHALIAYRQAKTPEEQARLAAESSARWDLLADAALGPLVWKALARRMGAQGLRMNLNTLLRQGALHQIAASGASREWDQTMVDEVARRIADPNEVRRSRQFPYQYLAAYLNASDEIPQTIKTALRSAAETACDNVPKFAGPVVVGLDVSGSMASPITGHRGRGATTKMRCVDVAALFAAAVLRRNPDSVVVPFDTQAHAVNLDPDDSILSLAQRLAKFGGGGTDCSTPIREVNRRWPHRRFAGVVLVSDMESWVYQGQAHGVGRQGSTGVQTAWEAFVANQRKLGQTSPKLACINVQPYTTVQAPEQPDVLNVGGFSDAVFRVVAAHLDDDSGRFVREIEAIEL